MLTKLGLDARTRHRTRIGRTLTGRGAELLISDADGKRAAGAMKLALALLLAAAASAQNENVIVLDGSGTTNPSKYFWDILALFEARAKPVVHMTYRAVGSSTGQFEFMGEDNPVAAPRGGGASRRRRGRGTPRIDRNHRGERRSRRRRGGSSGESAAGPSGPSEGPPARSAASSRRRRGRNRGSDARGALLERLLPVGHFAAAPRPDHASRRDRSRRRRGGSSGETATGR